VLLRTATVVGLVGALHAVLLGLGRSPGSRSRHAGQGSTMAQG
jgi:hypothetical protein